MDITVPLSERMRPRTLDELVGQEHVVGPGKLLTELSKKKILPSLVFWGPPGCGKTTLAKILGQGKNFKQISAVLSGVAELRKLMTEERDLFSSSGPSLLFVDEIHRWNKTQQDGLLPGIESGQITLIGATTENPSFSLISPLLSRCRVCVLKKITPEDLKKLLWRALCDKERGLGREMAHVTDDAMDVIVNLSSGDSRNALNLLEMLFQLSDRVNLELVELALSKKVLRHDKSGESHYDTISAFIKSMRASDPDATLHYLARLYESGEDPRFIARRMMIFASEDIGNADPQAMAVAHNAAAIFDRIGEAEGWIPLSQAALYLALAPKSRASYEAYVFAKADLEEHGDGVIPLHLRNAPTQLMKDLGYGRMSKEHTSNLPEGMRTPHYYKPIDRGFEKVLGERIEWLKKNSRSS